jgi:hypothetical protein
MASDTIYAYGHENVLCTHSSTIEITKDTSLTSKGDCILGINSSKACFDLDSKLMEQIYSGNKCKVTIMVEDLIDIFYGYGDEKLPLLSNKDMIFRKSDFICNRTVLINCTKSSLDLNRDLINALKINGKKITIILEIIDSDE